MKSSKYRLSIRIYSASHVWRELVMQVSVYFAFITDIRWVMGNNFARLKIQLSPQNDIFFGIFRAF